MRAIEGPSKLAVVVVAALAVAGCGGNKPAPEPAGGGGGGAEDTQWQEQDSDDPSMIGAERMDEIKAILDRKRTSVSRCLADVVNAGKVDKNARGHVALGFVIGMDGKATSIEVVEDSLASPDLERCVIAKVAQIDFGALPRAIDWAYTFAFESM